MYNKRLIIITSIVTVVLIGLSVLGFVLKKPAADGTPTTYYDKGSKETVIENNASQQGSDTAVKNVTLWLGFSTLLDRGLSPEQIQSIETTIKQYALQKNTQFKEVSLTVDSYRHILPQGNDTTQTLTFDITVNRTDAYSVVVTYNNLTTCVTKLYTSDKKTLLIQG